MRSPGLPRADQRGGVPRVLAILGGAAFCAVIWFALGRVVLAALAAGS